LREVIGGKGGGFSVERITTGLPFKKHLGYRICLKKNTRDMGLDIVFGIVILLKNLSRLLDLLKKSPEIWDSDPSITSSYPKVE